MTQTATPHWQDSLGYMHEIKVGMFGLARIGGLLGKLIAAGQAFAGDGSRWTHAFVVVQLDGKLKVVEAEPGGARIADLDEYLGDKQEVVFCDEPVQARLARVKESISHLDLTDEAAYWGYVEGAIRADVNVQARKLKGTRYGYLQYVYMGLVALGLDWKWLERRISQKGSMICSQLVDEVYRRCGIQFFNDGRLPQNVTPGDLAIRFGIA